MAHKGKRQSSGSFSSGSNNFNTHQRGESRANREQKKASNNPQRPRGGKAKNKSWIEQALGL